jgi:4-hydroxymandelate oxidase
VFVSNHGGRQLDGAPATMDVLEGVVDAVAGRAEVYLDGGIRRGTDVVKALALGARAVAIGRPVVWALGAGGERGVTRMLSMLRDECDNAMALCGAASPDALDRSLVV